VGLGRESAGPGGLGLRRGLCVCCDWLTIVRCWASRFRACLLRRRRVFPGSAESKRGPGSRSRASSRKVLDNRFTGHGPPADCLRRCFLLLSSTERNEASVTSAVFVPRPDSWSPAHQCPRQALLLKSCRAPRPAVEHLPRLVDTWPSCHREAADPRHTPCRVLSRPERWAGSAGRWLGKLTRPARWIGGKGPAELRRRCCALMWNHRIIHAQRRQRKAI